MEPPLELYRLRHLHCMSFLFRLVSLNVSIESYFLYISCLASAVLFLAQQQPQRTIQLQPVTRPQSQPLDMVSVLALLPHPHIH